MKKYLFIDRDGTLVTEPEDYQVDALSKVKFERNVIPALLKLKDFGYTFVMVSNQDGLGTDSFPLNTFTPAHELILNTLESQGISFEQVLICPHKPEDHCSCRKPELGLVLSYLKDTTWDREHSYFIGDRETDVKMGLNMGIKPIQYSAKDMTWDMIADDLTRVKRVATVERNTRETKIKITVDLDNPGNSHFDTGVGFFDHMLDQIATHGGISIDAKVTGDLYVDDHHTIEDTGIALGQAILKALGDKRGILNLHVIKQVRCQHRWFLISLSHLLSPWDLLFTCMYLKVMLITRLKPCSRPSAEHCVLPWPVMVMNFHHQKESFNEDLHH